MSAAPSEALLAEPINAASNGAFLLAALAGLGLLLLRPREQRSADHYLLISLVLFIGLGSLAFHLYATGATELADVLPIGVFMLVYLGFALNRFLGVPAGWTVLLVIGFTALMAANGQVKCWDGGIGIPGADVQGVKPCLNGSLFYLPALAALIVVGLLLEEKRHRGRALSVVGGRDPRRLGHAQDARHGAVRQDHDRRPQGRHPFRLACSERAGAVPAAQSEPRRRSRGGEGGRGGPVSRGRPD